MVTRRLHDLLYEKRILNGEPIVMVFKKEGVKGSREKYPNTPIYSIREVEALDGLETVEQRLLQEAKQIFGGAIFTEENFYKYYPKRNKEHYGSKSRV